MNYHIIVATDLNNGIGYNNQIPWDLPADLKFFKQVTTTTSDPQKRNAIVMGRNTFESIGRPLPNRLNILLTRNPPPSLKHHPSLLIANSLEHLQTLLNDQQDELEQVFFIGGQDVYQQALNNFPIHTLYKTVVHTHAKCDRFFPATPTHRLTSQSQIHQDNPLPYHIELHHRV